MDFYRPNGYASAPISWSETGNNGNIAIHDGGFGSSVFSQLQDASAQSRILLPQRNGKEAAADDHYARQHKRDLSQAAGPASEGDADESKPKKPRMALSCSECKRRKIRCDRNVPCTACIKRGSPETCNWEEARIDPTPQPFALREDVADLREQVLRLQAAITKLQDDFANSSRTNGQLEEHVPNRAATANVRGVKDTQLMALRTGNTKQREASSAAEQEDNLADPAEDAAIVLESVAFHPPSLLDADGSRVVTSHEFWIESNHPKSADRVKEEEVDNDNELTLGLTSIKAPRWDPWQEQFSALLISKDLSMSNSLEITAIRMESLNVIYSNLPTPDQSRWLLQKFKERVHWRIHVLHLPCFEAELAKFWEMTAQGRFAEIDPLWIALFLMVMAITHDTRPASIVNDADPFKPYTANELEALTNRWHVGSLRALFLGDFMGTPRFRTIQTIVLFSQYFQQSRDTNKGRRWMYWLSIGVRTAHLMGLNSLGDDPEIMPPEDPALPRGKNSLKRNLALRVWMALQWADWKCASVNFQSYIINPAQTTTQLVDNVNDDDLSATEWRINVKPAGVATSTTFERYKWSVANMLRITYDKLATEGSDFSYVTVLSLDRGWRRLLDDMPELFKPPEKAPNEESALRFWLQQNVALGGVMARIVRLHRPFLSRGYVKDSKFAYSKQQCLSAAKAIIDCHHRIRPVIASGIFWFIFSQTLAATIVLYMDLFWSIDNNETSANIEDKKRLIEKIKDVFALHTQISNRSLQAIVKSAHSVVLGLAAETEHRQSSATARGVNPDLDALLPKPEPFADVLRRISTTLHSPKSDVLELAKLANAKQAASQLQPEMQIQWDQLGASLPSDSNAMSGGWSTYDTAYDFTSDIWSALGLTDHMINGTDASFTAFNLSPASQGVAADGQPDLSFLAGIGGDTRPAAAATNYLLHQTGGIGDTF